MMRTGHEVAPPWLYGRTTHHHQWSGWAHFRFLDIVGWCWMFDQNNHARQHLLMVLSGQSCRVVSFDSVSSRCFIEAMSWWTIGQRAISSCGRGSVAGCDWNASSMLGTTFGANNCRPRFSAGSMDNFLTRAVTHGSQNLPADARCEAWEYVPLGPFGAKNFGTTISPWIVPGLPHVHRRIVTSGW